MAWDGYRDGITGYIKKQAKTLKDGSIMLDFQKFEKGKHLFDAKTNLMVCSN